MYDEEKLTEVGQLYFENHAKIIEREIKANIIKEVRKHNYIEYTIKFQNRQISGVKIDKRMESKFKKYGWYVRRKYEYEYDKKGKRVRKNKESEEYSICAYKQYEGIDDEIKTKCRGKTVSSIIFEDIIEKLEKETGKRHIVVHRNEDKLDYRKRNIIFINKEEQSVYNNKNIEEIEGINEYERKFGDISYEVRIRKTEENIYLIKTTCKEKAIEGRYLLEIIFFGKSFIKTKLDKNKEQILLNLKNYKNKEKTLDDINRFLTEIKLDEDLINATINVIKKYTNLIY